MLTLNPGFISLRFFLSMRSFLSPFERGEDAVFGFTDTYRLPDACVVEPKARQSVTAHEEVASAWAATFSASDRPWGNGVFAYDASSRARFTARV
jgi:hypothetical protein